MSFMDKLLDGVEVEWRALADITSPTGNINWKNVDRTYRYIDLTSVNIEEKKITETSEITSENAPSRAKKLVKKDDVIFATTRPYQMRFCLIDDEYSDEVASTGYCVLRSKQDGILPKWILYCIASTKFKEYVEENQSGSAYPAISDTKVKAFPIPIPCPENPKKSLEIQTEIVRILDAFTALTSELITALTTELNLRKKQYNYYRDQLLSFEEGEVEWRALGEVAKIQRGASPRPIAKYISKDENGVPWIKIGDTLSGSKYVNKTAQKITPEGAKKSRILKKGDFILSNSMSFGRPYILDIDGAIHDGWASISDFSENLNSDYLYHYLSSNNVQHYWLSKINSGSVSNLNADIIKTLLIPLPCPNNLKKSLAEQERIVSILDKFDTLTNSISEGLPREIELRQKQYAYYRDLLLSFPKPEKATA